MSDGYLKKLSQSVEDVKKSRHLVKAGKLCGSVSMGIGAFTVFCGIIAKFFPSVFPFFAFAVCNYSHNKFFAYYFFT